VRLARSSHDSDESVGDEDDPEECVLQLSDGENRRQECPEEEVEAGDHVRSEDLANGSTGVFAALVRLAPLDSF
jgi:hypothetical protein